MRKAPWRAVGERSEEALPPGAAVPLAVPAADHPVGDAVPGPIVPKVTTAPAPRVPLAVLAAALSVYALAVMVWVALHHEGAGDVTFVSDLLPIPMAAAARAVLVGRARRTRGAAAASGVALDRSGASAG
ncbi:MAG: hypothetical protein U0W40_07470 [Acidimicrobiia bacterium]